MVNLKSGIVGFDDWALVYGQWDDDDRWNGWLNPEIDPWGVEFILGKVSPGSDPLITWEWEEDGTLVLTETQNDEHYVERVEPDEDGLYGLGGYGWTWSEYRLDDAMRAWLDQNELAAASISAMQCAQVEAYAEHHAGGLYVLMYERRVDDGWLCTKVHDSWGDDGKVVMHTYNPDLEPDDTTVQREQYFDTGAEAIEAFIELAGDSSEIRRQRADAWINVSNAVNQALADAGVGPAERRPLVEQASRLAAEAWDRRKQEERRG